MSLMEMYVTDRLYLNSAQTGEKTWIIHLSNGEEIAVEEAPEHNGKTWAWSVNNQIFGRDDYALSYLKGLVAEKLTGKRIIFHAKRKVPCIC